MDGIGKWRLKMSEPEPEPKPVEPKQERMAL
jgi:hypothetical protein